MLSLSSVHGIIQFRSHYWVCVPHFHLLASSDLLSSLGVAGAIAAGNAVVLKPSEVSVHASAFLAELIPKYAYFQIL